MDRSGGAESKTGDATRPLPTPFLTKTYQLVDDHSVNDVISWNEDGSSFTVWNQTEFARDLLPKYFKHNNFSSFVRQLNTYGFRKVVPDRWEFSNEFFRRGEKKLLRDIQRRKIATSEATTPPAAVAVQPNHAKIATPSDSSGEQVLSSSNSPAAVGDFSGSVAELIGENERLRKQNVQLNKEMNQMKNLCNNIYNVMSNYASNSKNSNDDQRAQCRKSDSSVNALKPLDLLPTTRCYHETQVSTITIAAADGGGNGSIRSAAEEINASLFGVSIGMKRGREGEGCTAVYGMDLQLQQPGGVVKSEPLDEETNGDDQAPSSSRNKRVCN